MARLAIKIDVDTDRGTREGVPRLLEVLQRHEVSATFLFSLGPDNTGKAIRRIFRPGFLQKVRRTNVAGNYGLRTLMNGTLLPAPKIGERNADVMRSVRDAGFSIGIHCWDHFQWQDYLHDMSTVGIRNEFQRACDEFQRIFDEPAQSCGAPGWQCNERALAAYDNAGLLWASDSRSDGSLPTAFFPKWEGEVFKTLHISTTLPTLDELMGRPEYPDDSINDHYLKLLQKGGDCVHTIHAELEGLHYAKMFEDLIVRAKAAGVTFFDLDDYAKELLQAPEKLPVCDITLGEVDGRSGTVTVQKS
ncbi:polysaccharide deacetylase family protein [Rubellicoccus peritrichatus]|uniref:Polysaccharide deacetylase family protein n=1 Tax=Rubellicoccus peritrichatus TaxID=3080537 RepID=A0AAQ3L8N1_9BACT|nr:polysaccharide deacetylase family protein [Puniceicoccus sp. CR14]WOO40692.1 polysaccharide deacetylase family protein [Puniceicoccus sp. CR14]